MLPTPASPSDLPLATATTDTALPSPTHENATLENAAAFDLTAHTTLLKQWLRQAEFMMSAPKLNLCVPDTGHEIAFVGRSNAGKSSAINTITDHNQLAKASKKPGRTQMINFFSLGDPEKRLVDLPGYGYAAVAISTKRVWQKELERYLNLRDSLQGLVLLMDIRHPLQPLDVTVLELAKMRGLFVHILLTKADKLNRGPANTALQEVKKQLKKIGFNGSIQLFSAPQKQGLDDIALVMAERLQYHPPIK